MAASAADGEQAGGRVLLTGATGYVGGRLLRKLEESGRPVRCMARRPATLWGRAAEQTEIAHGDVLEPESLAEAFAGVTAAYYLLSRRTTYHELAPADLDDRRRDRIKRRALDQLAALGYHATLIPKEAA